MDKSLLLAFLEWGADLNQADFKGYTPIIIAIRNNYEDFIDLMLFGEQNEESADLKLGPIECPEVPIPPKKDMKDNNGKTPIHHVV